MKKFFNPGHKLLLSIPTAPLAIGATLLLIAPGRPMPHVLEKLLLLSQGALTRPLDIFDLLFHLFPALILVLKLMVSRKATGQRGLPR